MAGAQTNGAAQANGAAQTPPPAPPPPPRRSDEPPHEEPPRSGFGPILIALAGAAITATVIAAAVTTDRTPTPAQVSSSSESTLDKVATADLAGAAATLDPAVAQQTVSDAKACKAPIAWVTLAKLPGGTGGMVRIRSGSYLSPAFALSDAPQRVAIPYPAPYATGRGVLWMVGEAKGLDVHLYPGWSTASLDGAAAINVWWIPTDPC
jgi:hypothetical protein